MHLDIHLGAHKTATTFMQLVFKNNASLLKEHGIIVPHHRLTRKFLTVPCQLKAYERLGQQWNTQYTDEELSAIIGSFFYGLEAQDPKRVLLSEENLIGHCGHIVLSGILYSRKQIILSVLKDFLPIHPRRIYFSIRDYADFFSSVYGQYLADVAPENYISSEVFVENVMKRHPSWFSMATAIKDAFPDAELIHWRYEDAKSDWSTIMREFFGENIQKDLKIDGGDYSRRSMTQGAFLKFRNIVERRGESEALGRLKNIINKGNADEEPERLNIFTDEQVGELNRRYEKHVGQLNGEPSLSRNVFASI